MAFGRCRSCRHRILLSLLPEKCHRGMNQDRTVWKVLEAIIYIWSLVRSQSCFSAKKMVAVGMAVRCLGGGLDAGNLAQIQAYSVQDKTSFQSCSSISLERT